MNILKKGLLINVVISVIVFVLYINSIVGFNVYAKGENEYVNQTVTELKREIKEMNRDGKLSQKERMKLISDTNPEVRAEYIKEEIDRAFDKKMKFDFKIGETDKATIDIGNGTIVEYSYKDEIEEEENSGLSELLNKTFFTTVYAREESDKVTKKYGDRKCSNYFSIICGVGVAELFLTNHYTLSKNGIKERYGDSSVNSLSLLGTVSFGSPVITDKVATKPGKSNTNMKCDYNILLSGVYLINAQYSYQIESILKYDSINKKNKTITLTQKFRIY